MKKFLLKTSVPASLPQLNPLEMLPKHFSNAQKSPKRLNKRAITYFLALLLFVGMISSPSVEADTLAVTPINAAVGDISLNQSCADEVYINLVKSQKYQVLPTWYVVQQLQGVDWENNWEALFASLPEADEVLLLHLNHQTVPQELIALWLKRGHPPLVLKTETLSFRHRDPFLTCTELSHLLLGEYQPVRFRNPALSATLSFIVPGAGHFYQGTPESIALGSLFLLTYLVLGGLGFSSAAESQVTRSQWGGMMLVLTLTDIVTAYFIASQEP